MKKLSILIFLFSSAVTVNAQIKKGEKMVGGSFGVSVQKNENNAFLAIPLNKSTSFNAAPQISFGLGRSWVTGVGVAYSFSKTKNEDGVNYSEIKNDIVTFGAYLRKFQPLGDKVGIYAQAEVSYGVGTSRITQKAGSITSISKSDVDIINANIRPGFYVKASPKFLFEATFGSFGYTHSVYTPRTNPSSKQITNNLNFSISSSLNVGFQIIL